MQIPDGVNYIEFYIKAKAKGIKIKSNYKGVYVGRRNNNKDIVWKVLVRINGKQINVTFPFTKEGELQAYEKYRSLKKEKESLTQ